jgi:hypothetical protein
MYIISIPSALWPFPGANPSLSPNITLCMALCLSPDQLPKSKAPVVRNRPVAVYPIGPNRPVSAVVIRSQHYHWSPDSTHLSCALNSSPILPSPATHYSSSPGAFGISMINRTVLSAGALFLHCSFHHPRYDSVMNVVSRYFIIFVSWPWRVVAYFYACFNFESFTHIVLCWSGSDVILDCRAPVLQEYLWAVEVGWGRDRDLIAGCHQAIS